MRNWKSLNSLKDYEFVFDVQYKIDKVLKVPHTQQIYA
jgi:hypothetical protein